MLIQTPPIKRKPILFKKISWVIKILLRLFGFLVVLAVQ
jgi:hypothetical protein